MWESCWAAGASPTHRARSLSAPWTTATRCTTSACMTSCGASGAPYGPPGEGGHIPVDTFFEATLPCRGRLPGACPMEGGRNPGSRSCSISWMSWSLCHVQEDVRDDFEKVDGAPTEPRCSPQATLSRLDSASWLRSCSTYSRRQSPMTSRRMFKCFALFCLILALPVAAQAQTSRVEGMAIQGDYIKDYTG